jgi:hypothetical protein
LVKKKTGRFGKKWGHFWLKKTQGRFGKKWGHFDMYFR